MKKFLCILSTVCAVSAFGQVLPQKGSSVGVSNHNCDDIEMSYDGNRAVVSSALFSGYTPRGLVRVVEFVNGSWSQIGNDILGDKDSSRCGYAVAISDSGDRIAVTQESSNTPGITESVRVFEDSLGNWVQVGSEIPGSNWHCDISGDGTRIAIGDMAYTSNQGRIRIFEDSLDNWVQIGNDIVGDSAGHRLGRRVKLSQDGFRIITGAYRHNSGRGQAKVFQDSSGTWVQVGNALEGDSILDWFGYDVSISNDGSRIAIGSQFGRYARVFEDSSGTWVQEGSDILDTTSPSTNFRTCISISGDGEKVAFGQNNIHFVYEIDSTSNWTILGHTFGGIDAGSIAGNGESYGVIAPLPWAFYTTPCSFIESIIEDIDTVCSNGLAWVNLTDNYSYDSIYWSNGDSNVDSTQMIPGWQSVYIMTTGGCDTTLSFQIQAIQNPPINVIPCYIYCDLDTGLNRIVVETPTDFSRWYEWQLLVDVFGTWSVLSSRPIQDTSVWYHSNSNPFNKSYSYKLQAIDSCGVATASPIVKTILLQSSQGTSGEVNLNWNAYEGADVWYYVINRKQGQNFVVLDSVGATTTTYIDNNAPLGNVSYYVTAVRQSPCGSNLFKSGANTRKFSSNTVSESVIGIDESSVNKISIHPNPTSGLIQVQLDKSFDYEVYDLTGKLLAKDSGKEQIDISKLPAGTYTVIITSENRYSNHIVQKL